MNTLPPLPVAFGPGTPALRHDTRDYYDGWNACHAAFASAIAAQAPASVQPELPPLPPELLEAINDCATLNYLNPAHQTETISALKNEIRDYARAAIAQPVQPTPLTYSQIVEVALDAGYTVAGDQGRADFICGIRHCEQAHGISAPVVPTLSSGDAK